MCGRDETFCECIRRVKWAGTFGLLPTFLFFVSFLFGISLLHYPYVAVDGALASDLPFVCFDSSFISTGWPGVLCDLRVEFFSYICLCAF